MLHENYTSINMIQIYYSGVVQGGGKWAKIFKFIL